MAAAAVPLTREVMLSGKVAYSSLGGFFYVDSLSIIVLDIVLAAGLAAGVYSVGYTEEEIRRGRLDAGRLRLYYILTYSFLFTMVLAMTVKNMGIMWIAIEATTLASAFLVGLYNNRRALEAAWKYVIICSVGIAIALLGITLLHLSSIGVLEDRQFLDWTALYAHAKALNGSIARLAFVFILIGFGTKAPCPDAHVDSRRLQPVAVAGPAPVGGSFEHRHVRHHPGHGRRQPQSGKQRLYRRLLMAMGILSILTAAMFILTQKDYQRLLAYSSIEHMASSPWPLAFSPRCPFPGPFFT
jgi:hydrogenase-4 component F